jgi:hypothetical protein
LKPTPETLAEELSGASTVEFLVVSHAESEPIAGAEFMVERASGFLRVGASGDDGRFVTRMPDDPASRFIVNKDGFAPQDVRVLATGVVAIIRIELEVSEMLEGRVLHPSGRIGGSGVHVVAWPNHLPFPKRPEFDAWLDGQPSSLLGAETREDGSFSIPGVVAGRQYRVVAGARGLVSKRMRVRADGESVEVQLFELVGVQVSLREEGGGVPQLTTPERGLVVSKSKQDHLEMLPGFEPRLALSDLPELASPEDGTWDRRLLFFSDTELESTPVVSVEARFPGYVSMHADIELLPLTNGIPRRILELVDTAKYGRGSILVEFEGYLAATSEDSYPPGTLELVAEDRTWGASYSLSSLSRPFAINGLPLGAYSYRFRPFFDLSSTGVMPAELTGRILLDSAQVILPLDFSEFGAIRFKVEETEHRLDGIRLRFTIASASGRAGDLLLPCQGGLRRVDIVTPGAYSIQEEYVAAEGVELSFSPDLVIRPGELTEVLIRVVRSDS